jgi:hypothetical protein
VVEHHVGRWTVPACEITVPAVSIEHARELVVKEAHRRAGGVPPWRPFTRESLRHATAEPTSRRRMMGSP